MMRQAQPNSLHVEMSEGCNLWCDFCGLRGIKQEQGKGYKFLSLDDALLIAKRVKQSGWNSRIEFAMHGEPTMNPNWVEILKIFRRYLPKQNLMLTTNGGGFLKRPGPDHWISEAISCVNFIAIDAYEYAGLAEKIEKRYSGDIPWYPDNKELNPHTRRKFSDRAVVFIRDISVAARDRLGGVHSNLRNHAGCGGPKTDRGAGKRCAMPFREFNVRWDGSVAICCNDWRGYYSIGNVVNLLLWKLSGSLKRLMWRDGICIMVNGSLNRASDATIVRIVLGYCRTNLGRKHYLNPMQPIRNSGKIN